MNHAILTVDLSFGDAGKGSIVDFLARHHDAHTVIRYNGGAQAGHRVVTPDGREYVFSQFGSGTFAGARTHLSRFMLLDPLAMEVEAAHLQKLGESDMFARVTIDERALVVTPFQRSINRLRELARGDARHGSCGMGIGETVADSLQHREQSLRAKDLMYPDRLRTKLRFLRAHNLGKLASFADSLPRSEQVMAELEPLLAADELDWLVEAYRSFAGRMEIVPGTVLHSLLHQPGTVIFEGAQGVLLDEWRGFHPHTTWSTTTLANATRLLVEANYTGPVTRLGITRAYATRHGAGPFVTEDPELAGRLPDPRNGDHTWQQRFRVGWLDLVMLRYAKAATGPLDGLAVTCLDRLAELSDIKVCTGYEDESGPVDDVPLSPTPRDLVHQARLTRHLQSCTARYQILNDTSALLDWLAAALDLPVALLSRGEAACHKEVLQELCPSRHGLPAQSRLAFQTRLR